MTAENRELLIRAVGILVGLMFTTTDCVRDALELVINDINKVLEEDKNGNP